MERSDGDASGDYTIQGVVLQLGPDDSVVGHTGGNERCNNCVSTTKAHPSGGIIDPPCFAAEGGERWSLNNH